MTTLLDKVAEHCVGLDVADAKAKITKAGASCRLTEVNGKAMMVDAQFDARRINLDVNNNIVIRARVG